MADERTRVLEIELAARRGETHLTCGGRTLNDDVMDTIFTQLVNAGHGPTIRDGVDAATRPGMVSFPYLASPNPNPPEPPAAVSGGSGPANGAASATESRIARRSSSSPTGPGPRTCRA